MAAFVSTNSITQGEQVAPLWGNLFEKYDIQIIFAYRTFRWDSEANIKAHVHCVIIGFADSSVKFKKVIYEDNQIHYVNNISPYLIDAPNIIVDSFTKPICNVQPCVLGNTAKDNGYLLLNDNQKDKFLIKYPDKRYLIRRYIGGRDFIHNDEKRYCFWLRGISPNEYINIPELKTRLAKVQEFYNGSVVKTKN